MTLPSSSLLPISFRSVFFFFVVVVVVPGSTVDSVEAPILATTPLLRAKSLGCKLQRLRCALNRRSSECTREDYFSCDVKFVGDTGLGILGKRGVFLRILR